MFAAVKNKEIRLFNESEQALALNAEMVGLTRYEIVCIDEDICAAHDTQETGVYYKESEMPPAPQAWIDERERERRRMMYREKADDLTLRRARKTALGTWSADDERGYVETMRGLSETMKE